MTSAPPGPRPIKPKGDIRLLFVADISSHAREPFTSDPATPDQIERLVDHFALSGADALGQEVFGQGWVTYFRSDTYEFDQRPQHRRWIPLLDQGINPIEIICERAHERGMKFIAGARFGDDHGAPTQGAQWMFDHPEFILKDVPPGPLANPGNAMDFSFKEVRDFHFGAVEEIARRFDVDGIEITFRSDNHFPYPRSISRERQHLMTELFQGIRDMLDDEGRNKGRKLLLGVRVPETIEECHDCGLDIPTWITTGILDYVSPANTMYANHNAQWEEFSSLTKGTSCLLLPGVMPFCSASDARSDTVPWALQPNTGESGTTDHMAFQSRVYLRPMAANNYRALANNMYGAGADGVSSFNYQEQYTGNLMGDFPGSLGLLKELRDPDAIRASHRTYLFRSMMGGTDYHGGPGMASTGAIKDDKIVLSRDNPADKQEYRLRLCEQWDEIGYAYAALRAQNLRPGDDVALDLNGVAVPDATVRRMWHENGRSTNIGRPLPAYSTVIFDLNPDAMIDGDNTLGVTLTNQEEGASGDILIDDFDVTVMP
ncbi:MAG: family 10 glycosylhydrolase [Dehalococcoidia bacterium]|nr:family 10 glycosylhydrolase [Dehalococcoidia bacterium]